MTYSYAVDVSNNQAAHQPWKSFGVHLGIAKASEGQHTHDVWFGRHMADITAAGLLRGAYHFAWPNQDAAAEAANYVSAVATAARFAPMIHILDLEPYTDGHNYAGRTAAQIKAYATAWVAAVKKAFPGQRVLCYTPRDNYAKHYPANADGYWYPAYPVQGRTFNAAAKLARPVVGGHDVWGWQFASIPRDQSVIYMTPQALDTWVTGRKEDDMEPFDVWAYNGKLPNGKPDPKDAFAYLRDSYTKIGTLTDRLAALQVQLNAMGKTLGDVAKIAAGGGDDTKTAAALNNLADALRGVQTAAHDGTADGE